MAQSEQTHKEPIKNPTVGFLGLGVMGRPMAENMAKKHTVLGFDLDPQRYTGLSRVVRAESVREIAESCSVVCLSLPSAAVAERVMIGPDGLGEILSEGCLVIDFTTSTPSVSQAIAARLAERNVAFVDAPVSGGEGGAINATLSIMVGATPETFERCRPYLDAVGSSAVRVGETGAGNVAKLVNNMIVGSTFAVIAEGFALAEKNGIEKEVLYTAIRGGWAGSNVLEVAVPAMVRNDYTPGGTVDIMQKDLAYARTVATEYHVPVPMTAAAHELYVASQALGDGKLSQPVIIKVWDNKRAP
ncbi:MAG: NAD(P)-dependent oxidoreductase [Spirochaetaceae bacterium]|nr:MAG: NAD(P)-dependent oxidoreductase [Spirochaetaceae bacterium]